MENWNYETHEPGWVNNELQEYTDSEYIYVKMELLVLKEETEDGVNILQITKLKIYDGRFEFQKDKG